MRRTEIALVLRDRRTSASSEGLRKLRIELVSGGPLLTFQNEPPLKDESARKWAAKHCVFGEVATIATGCAYELRLCSDDYRLVLPTEQLFFQAGDFSIGNEPLTKISPALARLRAALPIEVVVEPLVLSLLLEVIDASTTKEARDVHVTLKAASSSYNVGLRRGVVHGVPLKGGGDEVEVDLVCQGHGRVQLAPHRASARAGSKLALKLFVRTSTLKVIVHEAGSNRRVLGSEVTLTHDAEVLEFLDDDTHIVAVGREYRLTLKAARSRHRGPFSFRCESTDYEELSVDEPLILHVFCEAAEADVDLDVADLASGAMLPRAHVQLGPHSLGVHGDL